MNAFMGELPFRDDRITDCVRSQVNDDVPRSVLRIVVRNATVREPIPRLTTWRCIEINPKEAK